MNSKEKYLRYKTYFLKTHKNKHGFRSYDSWKKKNKSKSKVGNSFNLFACDFETTAITKNDLDNDLILLENRGNEFISFIPNNKYSQVFLSGIWDMKTNNYHLCYENIADTINTIAATTFKNKKRKALAFFHNLSFDGSYILKWLLLNGWKQSLKINEKTKLPILKRHEFSLLMSGGKLFNIILYWKGIKIMFVDSLKILPQKLGDLGEIVGYKKLSEIVDYSKFKINEKHNYPSDWLIYLKRDCEILAKVLEAFFKKEKLSTKSLTIGSISFNHIKPIIKDKIPKFTIKDFTYWNQFYRGGLCFPSLKYQAKWVYKKQLIKMVDACSMYPSQMIKPLPFGEPSETLPIEWKNYCCFYEIKIIYANIKNKYKDIAIIPKPYKFEKMQKKIKVALDQDGQPIKTPYEYVQHVANEIYHVIDVELNLWEKLYDMKYEILKTWYFETETYLKEEVETMFIEKQQASRNKDKTTKMIAKLKINNLYGKLGQKPNKPIVFYGKKEDIPDTYEIQGEKHTLDEAYNVVLKSDESDKAKPVYVAAYITALSRVCLMEKYKFITDNKGTFLYCDTDSIAYVDNSKNEIKFNDIGDNLGQWEFEENKEDGGKLIGDGFISLCPKQYRIVGIKKSKPLKFACAGVNKEIMTSIKNQHYNFDLDQNRLYNLSKIKLKESFFGKVIDDNGAFSFKKWKPYFKKIICPKELKN